MRCLDRNKKSFYYANYSGMQKMTDSQGNFTGEYEVSYGEPIQAWGNISPARGTVYANPFGLTEGYDKVIVMADPDMQIAETSVLWVDNDLEQSFDYRIIKIARGLNSISIAIKKVDVDNA